MMLSSTQNKRQRQERILSSLEILKFATREQLQRLHNLGSDRNALKVLNQMKEYMNIQNHNGLNVYYLNKQGRDVIGCEDEVKWTLQAEHHLLRNDLYLHYGCPDDWNPEREIHFKIKNGLVNKDMKIIPDVTFTIERKIHLAEVDRTQSMAENKKKIENYGLISPYMQHQFGHVPVIVFYTVTEIRRNKLKELCADAGVMCEIYTKEDLR